MILQFVEGFDSCRYQNDSKIKAAVEREFEIKGDALNRIKAMELKYLENIDNWREVIGFCNVIAHGYDVVEDEVVWDSI